MKFSERKSIRGYYWHIKEYDENLALTIYQKKNTSPILGKLLALKNIHFDDVDNYLDPKIKNLLKDPYHLLDMKLAIKAIYDAIINRKNICIFGDYDVDGATATALMVKFFRDIGINVSTYIPDRVSDGYGMSEQVVRKLKQSGVEFIITVDCGISCHEAVDVANSLGMEVVITDHHIGSLEIPKAKAVVNPNRLDEESEYKYLAGVGVAFIVCIAINTFLRNNGYYREHNIKEPNLLSMLDLVALGTICDVMPLVNINRAFVRQGLRVFKCRTNIGLAMLSDTIGLNQVNDAYHLGYVIGPRINAGGRVGDVNIGNKLLTCEDKYEAKYLAEQLDSFNLERQNIEKDILDKAIEQVERNKLYNEPVIFIEGDNWHEGVIGIIASRLKDRYNRPVFVISKDGNIGKASCRSIDKSIDIGSVIIQAKNCGLLITGGGHAMAGGFTFDISNLNKIEEFIFNSIKNKLNIYLKENEKYADLIMDISSINQNLINEIENIGPFGVDNPEPIIILRDIVILNTKKFGKNSEHVKCIISSNQISSRNKTLVANIFRFNDKNISDLLFGNKFLQCDIVGTMSINKWMNLNNIQFTIEDIIPM